MTAYTSPVAGPPRVGSFVLGDSVTDVNGVVWRCVTGQSARQWVATTDPAAAGGAVNALTGMTVAQYGDSAVRKTVVTFSASPLSVPDAQAYAGRLLYTFPEGRILVLGATASLSFAVTSDRTTTINLNAALDWSVGTATASNVTLATTMVDLIPKVDNTLSAAGAAYNTATSGQLVASAHFDGTSAAKAAYLNTSFPTITDIDADGTLGVTGSITIVWAHLGDV